MNVNLLEFYKRFATEEQCIKFLEEKRWHGKIVCPRCNCETVYKFKDGKLYKCKDCRKKFTVRIGTIFEDSALPLQKWFFTIHLLESLKKGISSHQLARYLDITQKTAWFVLQRIQYATEHKSYLKPLTGNVQSDESYLGSPKKGERGRGAKGKTILFGLKQSDGDVRLSVIEDVKAKTLVPLIKANVAPDAIMMTDEFPSYNSLEREGYVHLRVNHRKGEYVNGIATVNGVENTWSHFKRGVKAIQIHISKKHASKYLATYAFRLNTKDLTDFERFTKWFELCEGKRLTYSELTA